MENKKTIRNLLIYLGIPIVLIIVISLIFTLQPKEEYPTSDIIYMFKNQQVDEYSLDFGTGALELKLNTKYKGKTEIKTTVASIRLFVDAVDRFLDKLAGVDDPETKRHIIGEEFIKVFAEEAAKLDGIKFLGQGTIYPDILESEAGIKAHHNVGGLPEELDFELVEPVKLLYKDEVRVVGKALGLPDSMVYRQPFPGPGLGVRCTGAITRDRLEAVRESDAILREEFEKAGLQGKVWQYFTVVPDYKSTGITDGKRTYAWPVVIRAINTTDVVEVTVEHLDPALIDRLVQRITTEVKGVNRVLFDYTPKPPATVEWE